MTARIGQADDAHLAAGARPALDARHDSCRDATRRRACFHSAREFCPGLHAQFLKHCGIVVERMPGQEKADRLVLPPQAFRRQPGLDLRQRNLLAGRTAAKQLALADRSRIMSALRAGKHRIDRGKHTGAVFLECIESTSRRETFQHPLINRARINARRKVGEIGEMPGCHARR